MAKKKSERTPLVITRPKKNEDPSDIADRSADSVIKSVNKQRKDKGLPPLPKS